MFFVFRVRELLDGTKAKSVYEFTSLDEATRSFHQNLGADMGSADVASVLCMIITSDGTVKKQEYYIKERI